LGLVVTIAVAVILGVHPFGSTELYDDGPRFVDHIGPIWVAIHVAVAVLLPAIATLSVASISITWAQRQWTTISEMGLLRPAITLFHVWFGLIG
jgi:hypothetical protein